MFRNPEQEWELSDSELSRRKRRATAKRPTSKPTSASRRPRPRPRPRPGQRQRHPRGCRCPACSAYSAPAAPTSEFVRWAQSSLNRVMNLRLPVDGVMSPDVRSAIRSFQRREGLPEDGIVGAATEAALRRAGGGDQEELEWGSLGEVLGEVTVNRSSPAYIRWVQASLNRLSGTRLAVDGISGPQTRAAVRGFQRQRGLGVDGIVGPITEAALIAAGAGNPPGAGSAPSPPPVAPPTTPTTPYPGGQTLGGNAAEIAFQEWQRWNQGRIKESDPGIRSVLEDYWRTGVGYVPSQSNWWSSVAWSAAFISWVMRKAGAGDAFKYSSAHTDYVGAAKGNRLANNSNPFKAYRIAELAPRVGDLVCVERQDVNGNWSGVTYDNVDGGFRASHCDVVTQVQPGALTVIGGNVSDSVSAKTVRTDSNGRISESRYYAVVRVGS